MSDGPLTYDDLAKRWDVCPRQVRRICKRWKLSPLDMGHRTKRFRPADVDRAEKRMAGEDMGTLNGRKAA
jgi:hypothetical protein